MAAALNIKNEEAVRLAHELAQEAGETITEAVVKALRERHRRYTKDARLAEIRKIAADMAPRLQGLPPSTEIGELLYDDQTGLPK